MNNYAMIADLGEAVVITDATEHPEPPPVPGAVAKPWNACTIRGCDRGPCPAKLRAWAGYGRRYICSDPECDHLACPARRRADEDRQPFGLPYKGPALPQHLVDMEGYPLGTPMIAVQDAEGQWSLWPMRNSDD